MRITGAQLRRVWTKHRVQIDQPGAVRGFGSTRRLCHGGLMLAANPSSSHDCCSPIIGAGAILCFSHTRPVPNILLAESRANVAAPPFGFSCPNSAFLAKIRGDR